MRIIKYVVEIIKIEYKQMIAMLLLISLLLILVMSSIMIKCSSNYAYEEIDRVIDVGIDNVAKIETDDSIFGNQSVIDKVNQINGVSFFGTMASYAINDSCFGEFENLQNMFKKNSTQQNGTEILFMNSSLFNICSPKLDSGMDYKQLDLSANTLYLYLGYEYYGALKYEVGDTFDDANGNHYEIAGIFRQGQRMIDEKLINEFSTESVSYSDDLDKMIICVEDKGAYSTGFWLGADEKHNISDIVKEVRDVLEENGYKSRFMTFNEMVEKGMDDGKMLYDLITKITIFVSIVAALMLITIFIITFLSELKRFGIMHAFGFSMQDIEKIVLLKNGFIVAVGTIISCWGFYFITDSRYGTYDNGWLINYLVYYQVYPKIIAGIIVFVIAMSIVIRNILNSFLPVEMIKGRY